MGVISDYGNSFRQNYSYHTTLRAIGDLKPFRLPAQKEQLLERLDKHLSTEESFDDWGRPHTKLHSEVSVIAFNPMDNHLHNLVHQRTRDGVKKLTSRIAAGYAREFNRDTGWRGAVFQTYAAKPFEELADPTQIKDMIAYIELNNPITQFETPFTSYQALIGNERRRWFDPELAVRVFGGIDGYREHMNRRGPAIVRRKLEEWGINPRRYPYRPI